MYFIAMWQIVGVKDSAPEEVKAAFGKKSMSEMRASVHRLLSGAGLTMRSGGGVTIFQVEANEDEKDAWLALFDLEDVTPMIELQWTLHQQKHFETRAVAKEYFNFVVEHPLTIIKCIPLHGGLKVQLRNCSESDWSIVRTRLLTCGSVKRFSAEESKVSAQMDSSMKESCKRRVEQLQNASYYAGIASKLFELHGVGGKSSKSRRLARDVASFVATTVRVTAHKLREAEDKGDDETEEIDKSTDDVAP